MGAEGEMRLYDTRRRRIVPFAPGPVVSMYVCGITPYDSTHLGHASTYLTYDFLIRRLEDRGHRVEMVRNITDVDDSILPKARELGVDFLELAAEEIARFTADMEVLEVRPAVAEPRATESIPDMIPLLQRLVGGGHTYQVDGITYFDVTTFESFGELSGYDDATMVDLARERGGRPDDPRQRNPLDFVLWQPSAADEPEWDSPVGRGRPGWHLECSAMSRAAHGPTVDLHGGATDLIFPHHECELAQSEAANGTTFARHWLHAPLVAYQGEKMSKSLGNLVFVSDLVKRVDPRAVRLAVMGHHYRQPWEWFDGAVDDAATVLDHLLDAARRRVDLPGAATLGDVRAALDDDLDVPRALAALVALADRIVEAPAGDGTAHADLVRAAAVCGLDLTRPAEPKR